MLTEPPAWQARPTTRWQNALDHHLLADNTTRRCATNRLLHASHLNCVQLKPCQQLQAALFLACVEAIAEALIDGAHNAAGPHRLVRIYRVREYCLAHRRKLRVPRSAVFILSTDLQNDNRAVSFLFSKRKRRNCAKHRPGMCSVDVVRLSTPPSVEGGDRSARNELCASSGSRQHSGST